jgi:type II secretory pathway pseudopilin PulG
MRRIVSVIVVVLIIGVVIVLALPSYADYTSRESVGAALVVIGNGRANLEASCSDGTFSLKQKAARIGVPESDPKAYILRVELLRVTPNTVRLRATLTDIYGRPFFGLFPWKVISQGSVLEFEYVCSAEKQFSSRLIASTVEQKYLPATLRN